MAAVLPGNACVPCRSLCGGVRPYSSGEPPHEEAGQPKDDDSDHRDSHQQACVNPSDGDDGDVGDDGDDGDEKEGEKKEDTVDAILTSQQHLELVVVVVEESSSDE